jgi:hypothetical protein
MLRTETPFSHTDLAITVTRDGDGIVGQTEPGMTVGSFLSNDLAAKLGPMFSEPVYASDAAELVEIRLVFRRPPGG